MWRAERVERGERVSNLVSGWLVALLRRSAPRWLDGRWLRGHRDALKASSRRRSALPALHRVRIEGTRLSERGADSLPKAQKGEHCQSTLHNRHRHIPVLR